MPEPELPGLVMLGHQAYQGFGIALWLRIGGERQAEGWLGRLVLGAELQQLAQERFAAAIKVVWMPAQGVASQEGINSGDLLCHLGAALLVKRVQQQHDGLAPLAGQARPGGVECWRTQDLSQASALQPPRHQQASHQL